MKNKLIEKIRRLISLNDTKKALNSLEEWISNLFYHHVHGEDTSLVNYSDDIQVISARFRELKYRELKGVISQEEVTVERAKINYSILEFANILLNQSTPFGSCLERIVHYSHHLDEYSRLFIQKTLKNYVIEKLLGIGGFGIVFRARNIFNNENVAIKISHPIAEITSIDELIHNSLKSLSILRHNHIVKIIDFGFTDIDNIKRCFIIMEYVEGNSLSDFLLNYGKEKKELIDIFLQVCEAIEYSHNKSYFSHGFEIKGLKHGDIKPSNILIDKLGKAKVSDFMFLDLIKLNRRIVEEPQFVFSNGYATAMHGTYGYMSPEQIEKGIVTEQSDVYSLGVLLLQMFSNVIIEGNIIITFKSIDAVRKLTKSHIQNDQIDKVIFLATQISLSERLKNVNQIIEILKPVANRVGGTDQ